MTDKSTPWCPCASHLAGYEFRLNEQGHRETRPIDPNAPQSVGQRLIREHMDPSGLFIPGWRSLADKIDAAIAAAKGPTADLLEALKEATHWLRGRGKTAEESGCSCETLYDAEEKIFAAIAKADGKPARAAEVSDAK